MLDKYIKKMAFAFILFVISEKYPEFLDSIDLMYQTIKDISNAKFKGDIGGDIVLLNQIVNNANDTFKEVNKCGYFKG